MDTKKVYHAHEIQKILSLGKNKTYEFLDEVIKKNGPFRVIKIGKLYRVHKESFDEWINKK